ncbi:haloacid dehalogenase [Sporosarcina sp. P37]|uniref:HAD family hydrolase n=1 Tax=unclassified Sporosarcina TaxID=2647733 RepID=UPI000A17C1D6|nr:MULTISPECIES: HAD-IB family hydrolase [unclassified Sporosarcina]ARK23880.1 haloacid dehalogenase [Sporosarcina sp. P37]PID17798.1 HAD-IB family hydrolase [Sporosarcina sp. P35]
MKVAIFDFDGTLYKEETFKLLMDQLKKHPVHKKYYGKFYRSILPLYIRYKLNILPESKMKERSMMLYLQALESLTLTELKGFFTGMQDVMMADFNEQVVSRLAKHRKEGYRVLLVSGAYTPFLTAVTSHLTFDTIIGTDIPSTGEHIAMDQPFLHIQGTRKTEQINYALRGESVDWAGSFAYGDSISDLPVLEQVGHPVAVRPDEKLRAVAKKRNWEIL